MTEIPEFLLKRAQAARLVAEAENSNLGWVTDSRIPEDLRERAARVRANSYLPAQPTAEALFGVKQDEDALLEAQKSKTAEMVAGAIATAHTFGDKEGGEIHSSARLDRGNYRNFNFQFDKSGDIYLSASTARSTHVSAKNLGVKLETHSQWQVPVEKHDISSLISHSGRSTLKAAWRLGRDMHLHLGNAFFEDAEYAEGFLSDPSAVCRKSAAAIIYEGTKGEFDATYGNRYGVAVCQTEGSYPTPDMASLLVPASGQGLGFRSLRTSSGFNTASGGQDSLWAGYVNAGDLLSRSNRGPQNEAVQAVATAVGSIIESVNPPSEASGQELLEVISQQIIPAHQKYSR